MFGQTVVHQLEVNGVRSLQQGHSSVHENSPVRYGFVLFFLKLVWDFDMHCVSFVSMVHYIHQLPVFIHRLMVECSSSPGSPGEVRVHVMDQPLPPPFHSTPATVTVQLRIATGDCPLSPLDIFIKHAQFSK